MAEDKFFEDSTGSVQNYRRLTKNEKSPQKNLKQEHIQSITNKKGFSRTDFRMSESELKDIMHASNLYSPNEIHDMRFHKFARYGMLDIANENSHAKEYLFFSKPDLHIFDPDAGFSANALNKQLSGVTFFENAVDQYPFSLLSLQSTLNGCSYPNGFSRKSKYMVALSNHVTSSLDIPDIQATETQNNTNLFQVTTTYRDGSEVSDFGFDFSLEFWDTRYLDIYMIFKAYDEYCRQEYVRTLTPVKLSYIDQKINAKQFSIWKIIVDETNTIIYYAKVTGVHPMGVPRSAISNLDGTIKITIPFKGQFVRDMDPIILSELNHLTEISSVWEYNANSISQHVLPLYNQYKNVVNTEWGRFPYVLRKGKKHGSDDTEGSMYKLVWLS